MMPVTGTRLACKKLPPTGKLTNNTMKEDKAGSPILLYCHHTDGHLGLCQEGVKHITSSLYENRDRVREWEREIERQSERERQTERERKTQREKGRDTEREIEKGAERERWGGMNGCRFGMLFSITFPCFVSQVLNQISGNRYCQ